jgi:hypothetical protein
MRETLIHEICHAVTQRPHGKYWNRRMMKAAERAERRGDLELSGLLKEEVATYESCYCSPRDMYEGIRSLTLSKPDCS